MPKYCKSSICRRRRRYSVDGEGGKTTESLKAKKQSFALQFFVTGGPSLTLSVHLEETH